MTESTLAAAVRAATNIQASPDVVASTESSARTDGISRADHEVALAAARTNGHADGHAAGLAEGRTVGLAEGATAERTRIAGILDHEAAKGRETLARHFAFSTGMKVEDAAKAMAAAPTASPAAPDPSATFLAAVPRPAVKPDADATAEMSDYDKGAAEAKRLLAKLGKKVA